MLTTVLNILLGFCVAVVIMGDTAAGDVVDSNLFVDDGGDAAVDDDDFDDDDGALRRQFYELDRLAFNVPPGGVNRGLRLQNVGETTAFEITLTASGTKFLFRAALLEIGNIL